MLLGNISPKQPAEVFPVFIDFVNEVDVVGGETVSTRTVTSKRLSDGADTSATFLSGASTLSVAKVTQKVTGGVSGERHRVQMRITTSSANTYEHELDVPVDEV
jgi:hypothetical protein